MNLDYCVSGNDHLPMIRSSVSEFLKEFQGWLYCSVVNVLFCCPRGAQLIHNTTLQILCQPLFYLFFIFLKKTEKAGFEPAHRY